MRHAFLPGIAALGLACACLSACLDSAFLHGKDCDPDGRCLEGYVCDPGSGKCVRPDELPDGGGYDDAADYDEGDDQVDDAGVPDGAVDGTADDADVDVCPCPDCQGDNFICVHGPPGPQSTGPPGIIITVRLDQPGYDPDDLVCYTQNQRLLTPETLLSNDFEADFGGFATVTQVERLPQSQSVLSEGSFGAMLCQDGAMLETASLDTTGRSRILLRYAAVADLLEDTDGLEFLISEYSYDGGASWFVLDIQGDGLRDADWQWFTHILPETCQGVTGLRFRFRLLGSDNPDDCAYVDDVSVLDLPEPTMSRELLSNHFEPAEGNIPTPSCNGDLITLFPDQIPDGRVCLDEQAQNPASRDENNQLGVLIRGRDSTLKKADIDTRFVPAGSDLVAGFHMDVGDLPPQGYANSWYRYRNFWKRMNGVGAGTAVDYAQRIRFVWDQAAIGLNVVQLTFWTPDLADGVNDSHSVVIDDFDLNWYRASHDVFGPFNDQGDGNYTAGLQTDLPGTAEVTCIFYGSDPPLVTDGSGINSGSYLVEFE